MSEHQQLPSIKDLYTNDALPVIQKESIFQVLVNQEPKPEWIQEHPVTKNKYIPIERVEWLLTNIFLRTRVKVKKVQLIGNSVVVTVRLFYFNQVERVWDWQDGVGAAPLQTDKGAGAIEFDKLKSSAVQMAAPAAESFAVKDAAEKIGKLFGRDVSRKNMIQYDSLAEKYAQQPSLESLKALYDEKKSFLRDEQILKDCLRILENQEEKSYKKLFNFLHSFQ